MVDYSKANLNFHNCVCQISALSFNKYPWYLKKKKRVLLEKVQIWLDGRINYLEWADQSSGKTLNKSRG